MYAPKFAGTSQPRLHFVDNQQRSNAPANFRHLFVVIGIGQGHAERGRDGFKDNGGGFIIQSNAESVDIVEGNLNKAGQVGPEGRAVLLIAGGESKSRVSVITAPRGNNFEFSGIAARQFYGQVDRFAAAHAEHRAVDIARH